MNLELTDKVAFVTGASSGIGAAVARVLAEEGVDVVVSYHRDQAGANETIQAVRSCGRQAWPCPMDLRDREAIARAVDGLPSSASAFDALILCAVQTIVTPIGTITPKEWDQVIQVNLSSAFYLLQEMSPRMREGASIVTVASVAAHTGAPHHAHYAAAKAGLVNLTKSAARDLAPRVRVNCVSPGITLTPMGRNTVESLPPDYAQKKLLVQRYASPVEIARCIVFVASPLTGFMTGATIDINGGRELR
ncbi:MAG: SDR family oxidoreductase [Chloroflexi bacterium]|nr:MAG: SDR family oxidoreductase [Chloroflexota bacterium]